MSINYAYLRRQVIETEQGANSTDRYSWLDLAQEALRMRSELAAMRRAWLSVVNDLQRMTIEKDLAAHVLVHIDSILGETND